MEKYEDRLPPAIDAVGGEGVDKPLAAGETFSAEASELPKLTAEPLAPAASPESLPLTNSLPTTPSQNPAGDLLSGRDLGKHCRQRARQIFELHSDQPHQAKAALNELKRGFQSAVSQQPGR